MAQLTVQTSNLAGLNKTYVSADVAGDTFLNDGQTYLFVKNAGASSINVTVTAVTQCNHGSLHNVVVAVPAGAEVQIGKFDPARFNNASGLVSVSYSAVTSVTVAVVRG